jgi:deazaflavin-dependent oxidoreductase (nitroreductase family)
MTERKPLDLSLIGDGHVERYRETNGEVGYLWNGVPTLILSTRRKSGELRVVPLIFGTDAGRFVVVASKGGAPEHPWWYRDLERDPHVEVQVQERVFSGLARTAEGDDRDHLWSVMTAVWPSYDRYQQSTTRVIPVVAIEEV